MVFDMTASRHGFVKYKYLLESESSKPKSPQAHKKYFSERCSEIKNGYQTCASL